MEKYAAQLIFIVMFLFAGCHKPDLDYPAQFCRITQLDNTVAGWDDYRVFFQYDRNGTPLGTTHEMTEINREDYVFRHDKKNRITDIIRAYLSGPVANRFSTWHRLKYDTRNRVIKDSTYYTGLIGENPIPIPDANSFGFETHFKYDGQDRIVQATDSFQQHPGYLSVRHYNYYYNQQGNLDSVVLHNNDGSTFTQVYDGYDSLVNIHRTNPLWQFIDRDYSRNNGISSHSSNKYGLPTQLRAGGLHENRYFLNLGAVGWLDIQYSCK